MPVGKVRGVWLQAGWQAPARDFREGLLEEGTAELSQWGGIHAFSACSRRLQAEGPVGGIAVHMCSGGQKDLSRRGVRGTAEQGPQCAPVKERKPEERAGVGHSRALRVSWRSWSSSVLGEKPPAGSLGSEVVFL